MTVSYSQVTPTHRLGYASPRFADDGDIVPKRSARFAAKNKLRAPKPEAQARKVLMKELGLLVETAKPDKASFEELQRTFKEPPWPRPLVIKREVMQVLFPGRCRRHHGPVTDVE